VRPRRYLVTGALGCIGAWTVRALLEDGAHAQVNVIGTLTVFEAAKRRPNGDPPIVYASSVAAYDRTHDDTGDEPSGHAQTHYGVYKRTNEGSAHVYWADEGIASIGLRPYVVYGPGRDQGITSEPTRAMLAAARGEGQHISYGGRSHMQYVEDVAQTFVNASCSSFRGAARVNLGGSVVHVRGVINAIETVVPDGVGRISFDARPLPFPDEVSACAGEVFHVPPDTPLLEGVRRTIERFREYLPERDHRS
jgi:UDP-glucuronate 4-epimerase